MTDDIKLPPPMLVMEWEGQEHGVYTGEAVKSLIRQHLDADRQQRGEPVAWLYASIAGPVVLHRMQRIGHAEPHSGTYHEAQLAVDKEAAALYPNAHSCVPLYTAPQPAEREAAEYAKTLATALHAQHYPEVTQWQPLPDTLGLLTQIDNMVCGLVRAQADENKEMS